MYDADATAIDDTLIDNAGAPVMLQVVDHIPAGLLEADPRELHALLGKPTLIELPGRREPPLFVSTLLHGNEDAGMRAMQALLRNHAGRALPRALCLFIGNVEAAQNAVRREAAQPDYNRVWPGTLLYANSPEHLMMCAVTERMRKRGVFASIDIHNNTGLNPYYSVVCHPNNRSLRLAVQFARTVTWFRSVHGSQTGAFAPFCPAVALECGKPGIAANAEFTAAFLETALHLSEIPDTPVPRHDIDLYHTVATVTVPAEVEFGFGTTDLDLNFDADFDHMNFHEWPTGTVFARTSRHRALLARDESGVDISDQLFDRRDGCLRLTRPLIPAMITLDQRVVRQDCLCYLMVRVPEQLASRANERPLP